MIALAAALGFVTGCALMFVAVVIIVARDEPTRGPTNPFTGEPGYRPEPWERDR